MCFVYSYYAVHAGALLTQVKILIYNVLLCKFCCERYCNIIMFAKNGILGNSLLAELNALMDMDVVKEAKICLVGVRLGAAEEMSVACIHSLCDEVTLLSPYPRSTMGSGRLALLITSRPAPSPRTWGPQ